MNLTLPAMFSLVVRRSAAAASVNASKRAALNFIARPITSSATIRKDGHGVTVIQGEGVPAGQVPTDEAQSNRPRTEDSL